MLYSDNFFKDFIALWQQLAAEAGGVPGRQQFNPVSVPKLLPSLYMLEWTGSGVSEVRLRGTGIEYSTQHRFTVGDHFKNFNDAEWAMMGRYFDTIFGGPCGATSRWRYYTQSGDVYDADTVSLPMWGKDGTSRLAIGMMSIAQNHDPGLSRGEQAGVTSDVLSATYFDVGYGVPEGAREIQPADD